jgi:hypothetical protein
LACRSVFGCSTKLRDCWLYADNDQLWFIVKNTEGFHKRSAWCFLLFFWLTIFEQRHFELFTPQPVRDCQYTNESRSKNSPWRCWFAKSMYVKW